MSVDRNSANLHKASFSGQRWQHRERLRLESGAPKTCDRPRERCKVGALGRSAGVRMKVSRETGEDKLNRLLDVESILAFEIAIDKLLQACMAR